MNKTVSVIVKFHNKQHLVLQASINNNNNKNINNFFEHC